MLLAQVYLQEFTWSEEDKPAAIARRADHAVHAVEHCLLTVEPMFCFQTAVALHRWSCLTYMSECPSMSLIHAPCHRLHMLFCSWVSTATWAGHDLLMSCSNPVQACPPDLAGSCLAARRLGEREAARGQGDGRKVFARCPSSRLCTC